MPVPKEKEDNYTYSDYLSWPENERWEIINGFAYNMSPAPSRRHQEISREIFGQIWSHFKENCKKNNCSLFSAPFDVRFSDIDIVQPDISIICDEKKLDDKGCVGSPDLIVEILSPSTAAKDMKEKLELYEKNKVKEYWIVHPSENILEVYKLKKNKYERSTVYSDEDFVEVKFLKDLKVDLSTVF